MKISINYDFFERIEESQKGISLKKVSKKAILFTGICTGIIGAINLASKDTLEDALAHTLVSIPQSFFIQFTFQSAPSFVLSPINKYNAIRDLNVLVQKLNSIYVPTNYDLLLKSYKYDTEYSINIEGRIPAIEQKKYIMVPVLEFGEEKEVSIVQEHIVGTKEYSISCGSPKKVLKPILKKA